MNYDKSHSYHGNTSHTVVDVFNYLSMSTIAVGAALGEAVANDDIGLSKL